MQIQRFASGENKNTYYIGRRLSSSTLQSASTTELQGNSNYVVVVVVAVVVVALAEKSGRNVISVAQTHYRRRRSNPMFPTHNIVTPGGNAPHHTPSLSFTKKLACHTG